MAYTPAKLVRLADVIRRLQEAGMGEEARSVKEAVRLINRLDDVVTTHVANEERDRLLARARNLTRKAP